MFKERFTLEKRKSEYERIQRKYPDRVPVIAEKANGSSLASMSQSKFLVPDSITIGDLLVVIRKRIKLEPYQSLFLSVKHIIPPVSSLVKHIHDKYKDEDGFLYIEYVEENTFGFTLNQ